MNNYYTYKEIIGQLYCWSKAYSKIRAKNFDLCSKVFKKDYDFVILFGCGSSYNIAMAASFITNSLTDYFAIAVPSSELIYNYNAYINKNKRYLLVGFSRSGETTESINALNYSKILKNVDSLILTCSKENSISNIANYSYYCRAAEEKSVVMTKSFSSMLFVYCMLLAKYLNNEDLLKEFGYLIDYMESRILMLSNTLKDYVKSINFNKFFSLGDGFNYGLAVEADLKVKEMTQIPSYSYYVMEFNHGPKSLIDKNSLILFLTIKNNLTKNISMMLDNFKRFDSKVLFIGREMFAKNLKNNVINVLADEKFKNSFVRSFINIVVFQLLSFYKTIELGLNPDKPRNLDYTTKMK